AGGRNVLATVSGYKPVSDEAVIGAAPDFVLMMDNQDPGSDPAGAADPFDLAAFRQVPAARGHRLIRMDGLALLGFGPRTP
ncbi:hypothetical protein, partial [Streptomyces galilaeus]|uniref:hypothetical protein n=1 Tax=Streptomyces galilaeus TaxID=33899 RepID=UPI0038F60CA1